MKIKWLGHASFLITSDTGTRIITDPYQPGYRDLYQYSRIDEAADIVTVSHAHGDHNYVASILGDPQVVNSEGASTVNGIEFYGLGVYHDRVSGAQRGPNIIFRFAVDGIVTCHIGDLGHPLDDHQARTLGRVDVLLLPVGGPAGTIDLDEAEDICRRLATRVIIPMHFKTSKCSFPKYSVDDFIRGKSNVTRVLGSELVLHKEKLPESAHIFVLEHAL